LEGRAGELPESSSGLNFDHEPMLLNIALARTGRAIAKENITKRPKE